MITKTISYFLPCFPELTREGVCVGGGREGKGRLKAQGMAFLCHFHFPQCHLSKVCGPGQRRLALLHLVPGTGLLLPGQGGKEAFWSVSVQMSLQRTPWLE